MATRHRIAVIPGDGIGTEVIPEGLCVLDAAAAAFDLDLSYEHFDLSLINGSLAGLPPTTLYSGSLDLLSVVALRLRDKAITEDADFGFVLRRGLIHDWPIIPFPEAFDIQGSLVRDLLRTGCDPGVAPVMVVFDVPSPL